MGTLRNFSAEFKAKIALEALVGDKTLAELAAKHDVHPNMIAQWKRHAKESLPDVTMEHERWWCPSPKATCRTGSAKCVDIQFY